MTGNKCLSLGLVLCLLLPLQVAAKTTVFFLYDEANPQHRNYVTHSETVLHQRMPGLNTVRVSLPKAKVLSTASDSSAFIVTVGASAARLASGIGRPTLTTLITRSHFESIKGIYGGPVAALYLEQPFSRMLSLVRTTLPERKQLTILLGPKSQQRRGQVNEDCQRYGLLCNVVFAENQEGIEEALQLAANNGKVMLVLPDPQIVSASTARNLILGAYRRGVALVGYSSALVKAGALMAVHSTLQQLGEDASLMVIDLLSRDLLELPTGRYPERYSVSVNYQLARALRLDLAPEASLIEAIEKVERNE